MDSQNKVRLLNNKLTRIVIQLFCLITTGVVIFNLLFVYEPDQNAPGALGSACMDVICMAVLLIQVISICSAKEGLGRTTRLCLYLILGTMYAVFFDFLTWSSDGSLEYGGPTYVYTICSLCSGAILAVILCLYISSYMLDMYEIKSFIPSARVCVGINIVAFLITVALGFTGKAFIFDNGHYETGALYDVITVLPILTMIYMSVFAIRYIKKIGLRDILCLWIYIFIMISGAIIEAIYGIGATYVAISVADVFIFVMLQNRVIDRSRRQKEMLAEEITSQFDILESMSRIYSYVNIIDFDEMTVSRFKESERESISIEENPHSELNRRLYRKIDDAQKEKFFDFTDLSTLSERMESEKIITAEFFHHGEGWIRAQYIRIGDNVNEPIRKAIYAIRNIDEEKKNVEKWIRKSNTDEVTGFYNRHAYEEDMLALENSGVGDDFVYVSMDVNGLKMVNDTLGHEAGDELIVGACTCMRCCFGEYGKLYRTGGDEFIALINADNEILAGIKEKFSRLTGEWHGKMIESLTISCGYVSRKKNDDMTIHQMASLADKMMYESKRKYYQKKGIDRRGRRDAHVALCDLYTKILKVNTADDTYQIINMVGSEQSAEAGFAKKYSEWISGFAMAGMIHPDDREAFLEGANLIKLRGHFVKEEKPIRLFYRRKSDEGYSRVMMEIIPAADNHADNRNLFLYVKDIDSI